VVTNVREGSAGQAPLAFVPWWVSTNVSVTTPTAVGPAEGAEVDAVVAVEAVVAVGTREAELEHPAATKAIRNTAQTAARAGWVVITLP